MELIKYTLNECLERVKQKEDNTGISTGFYDLDFKIKGLNKENLIIIASRPAMRQNEFIIKYCNQCRIKE